MPLLFFSCQMRTSWDSYEGSWRALAIAMSQGQCYDSQTAPLIDPSFLVTKWLKVCALSETQSKANPPVLGEMQKGKYNSAFLLLPRDGNELLTQADCKIIIVLMGWQTKSFRDLLKWPYKKDISLREWLLNLVLIWFELEVSRRLSMLYVKLGGHTTNNVLWDFWKLSTFPKLNGVKRYTVWQMEQLHIKCREIASA